MCSHVLRTEICCIHADILEGKIGTSSNIIRFHRGHITSSSPIQESSFILWVQEKWCIWIHWCDKFISMSFTLVRFSQEIILVSCCWFKICWKSVWFEFVRVTAFQWIIWLLLCVVFLVYRETSFRRNL